MIWNPKAHQFKLFQKEIIDTNKITINLLFSVVHLSVCSFICLSHIFKNKGHALV